MNFPFFHQVIVAGGLEPELRHSKKASFDTEKGSGGVEMVTVWGNTVKKKKKIHHVNNFFTFSHTKVMATQQENIWKNTYVEFETSPDSHKLCNFFKVCRQKIDLLIWETRNRKVQKSIGWLSNEILWSQPNHNQVIFLWTSNQIKLYTFMVHIGTYIFGSLFCAL